jgi:hypothetical protein
MTHGTIATATLCMRAAFRKQRLGERIGAPKSGLLSGSLLLEILLPLPARR